ncbi:MAG: hypothetical protein OXE99_08550 [Cellvibrionales bacterium]|nr:hypothetical protein [Cellvibrionales bacterium]
MKVIHLAIATNEIDKSIIDYTERLGVEPSIVIPNEYALWRTRQINLSIRQDPNCNPGELRHLGFEDSTADEFTTSTDVNGILWESFTAEQQADEINEFWPFANYQPTMIA